MDTAAPDSPSLLLVEENRSILTPLHDWLALAFPDIRLIETTDHAQGVSLNRTRTPDVVLVDISTLGRRGVEAVRSIKAAGPTAAVFALVALDSDSYRRDLLRAGAEACARIWEVRTELLPLLKVHLETDAEKVQAGAAP